MTNRIGVPWIVRGALLALILWFIGFLGLGTLMVIWPAFEHYLERLREGHRVEALRHEMQHWKNQETALRTALHARPASPPTSSVADWLGQFPPEITVLELTVESKGLELTVEATPDALWAWVTRAMPTWSGLSPIALRMQGVGPRAQLILAFRRESQLRIDPETDLFEPTVLPVWGPLSACPAYTLTSRIGRTAQLEGLSGTKHTVQVSDWVTADWQLIHISGRTLQWRSRLGTLCQSESPAS